MKKLTLIILTTLYAFSINGQSLVPVPNSYLTPAVAAVCETNTGFGIRTLYPPTLPVPGGWPTSFTLWLQVFVVPNIVPPFNPATISYPWTTGFPNCFANNAAGNPIDIRNLNCQGQGFNFPANASWNNSYNMFEIPVSLQVIPNINPIEGITYSVYLDCALKSMLGSNLNIVVKWYYTGGIITTPTFLIPSIPTIPVPVQIPNLVPILPLANSQFITVNSPYNPNGPNSDWYFAFQNNGAADANIRISEFVTDQCISYSLASGTVLSYAISTIPPGTSSSQTTILSGGLPWSTLFWNTLTIGQPLPNIPVNSFLYIRQVVTINGCMNTCNSLPAPTPPKLHFSWQCANAIIPPNCQNCQQDYDIELRFNKGVESYKITRISPMQTVAEQNTECQGSTTPWEFEVENTGAAMLNSIDVVFNNLQFAKSCFFVSGTDVQATVLPTPPCFGCGATKTLPIDFTPPFTTCAVVPTDAKTSFTIKITNLIPGGRVKITFDMRNIPSSDAAVFINNEKYQNQWRIQSTGINACGTVIAPDYTNSIVGLSNGISGYSKPNNNIYGIKELNLIADFYPTTTHITVPNQDPLNPYYGYQSQFYNMSFSGLFGNDIYDNQLMGAGSQISGYIKAEIECKQGLSISNPYNVVLAMPYNGSWVQIKCARYDHFTCGPYTLLVNPYNQNPVNVAGVMVTDYEPQNCVCDDKFSPNDQYVLYFKISDLLTQGGVPASIWPELFTQGKLIFGFTACCSNIAPSTYNIKLSLLPNESCFTLPASGQSDCNASGTGAVCCWLPLASKGGFVQVHCPGCKAPGIIVDQYAIERTSLGFEDANNNGLLPSGSTGVQINHSPAQNSWMNSYSKYGNLELYKSVYGDQMEDYLVSHFEPGDATNGGYSYSNMMTNQGINLGYIQLFRHFQMAGSAFYNLDITGFDFYIDDGTINGPCVDFEYFESYTPQHQLPTAYHLSINKALVPPVIWNSLFERGSAPNDDKMLFTFGESELSMLTSQTGLSVTPAPGYTINFLENQKYRLRVRYNVCGNKMPATDSDDDGIIDDFMYLKGTPENISTLISTPGLITNNQMPNSRSALCTLTSPLQFPSYPCAGATNVDQFNLGNPYFFYCEPRGGIQYFLSTSSSNTTTYVLNELNGANGSADCEAIVEIQSATSFLKANYANTNFKFEFKPAPIIPVTFTELLPNADWQWKDDGSGNLKALWVSTHHNGYNVNYFQTSPEISLSMIPKTNPAIINIASAPPLNCLQESSVANIGFMSDEASFQHLRLFMEPIDCSNFNNAPLAITPNHSEITFADNQVSCLPSIACSMSQPIEIVLNQLDPDPTLNLPDPNLQFNIAPGVYSANSGTVTWHFTLSNFGQSPNNLVPSPAKNVFIAFSIVPSFLSNLTVDYGNYIQGTVLNYPIAYPNTSGITVGNYFWLTPNGVSLNQLAPNYFLEGDITATVTNCSLLPSTFDFVWGWNCKTETSPPASASLCQSGTVPVTLNSIPGKLSTFTNIVPPSYTACDPDPQMVEACFRNMSSTELKPGTVTISPQPGSIVQLSGVPTISGLFGGSTPYTPFTGNGPWSFNAPVGTTLMMSDGFCIQFYVTTNDCNVGPLQLPDVAVAGQDICGNSFDINYLLPFIISSGISNCSDCYSITKTAGTATAVPGNPIMFIITVCANNATSSQVSLTDVLPQFFQPYAPIPQSISLQNIGCTNTYVTGIYTDVIACPNDNIATINYNGNSQTATACIDVACPIPPTPFYHVTSSDFNASSVIGNNPLLLSLIIVDDYVSFIIDVPLLFDQCTFIMGSGSRIVVDQNISMDLINSLIYSCPQMWQGITLRQGAAINTLNSTILDADEGIFATANSKFSVINSNIHDCIKGIVTEATGGLTNTFGYVSGSSFGLNTLMLKGSYAGQTSFGTIGRAGMLLNDVVMTIGDNNNDPNEFFNINYGIEIHNSHIDIINCRFDKIVPDNFYINVGVLKPYGCAINARATLDNMRLNVFPLANTSIKTITDATIGVYTNFYNARISNVSMENVIRGVNSESSRFCTVNVSGCEIAATYRGIDWLINDGANGMIASWNTIVVEPLGNGLTKGSGCIAMSETVSLNNANYIVSDNLHLETRSANFGISTTNVDNAFLQNNFIFTNQGILSAPGTQGITIYGGGNNTVGCNYVTNTLPHSNTGTVGMSVNISTNNRMECNTFGANISGSIGPYTGIKFGGDCDIFNDLAGNVMNECPVGLYLNNASRIGQQIHRGNKWNNPQIGNTTAINQNITNNSYLNSLVRYNPNSGFQYYPATISPSQWFDPDFSGTTFNGCGFQVCIPSIAGGGGDEEHLKEVARDSAISYDYRDENLNQAQQNLYILLSEDSILRASDSVFQNFYVAKQSLAIGQLQEVKEYLNKARRLLPVQEATIAMADSLIKMKTDSIMALDSANVVNVVVNYLTLREALVNDINTLNGVTATIIQQHEENVDSVYATASIILNAIIPSELPETNHKLMNEMVIQYRNAGKASVNNNYATLLSVAQQCPYAGGPAVYQARAMLELVNDSLEYNDVVVCLQSGIYRIMQEAVAVTPTIDFKLIPNPASQQVTVELNFPNEHRVHLEIRNILGGKIKELVIDDGIKSVIFSVENFEQGIYFVRVLKDGLTLNTKRLVIIK